MPNGGQFGQHNPPPLPVWEQVRVMQHELEKTCVARDAFRRECEQLREKLLAAERAFAQQITKMSMDKENEDD